MTKKVKWRANRKELRPGWVQFIFRTWTRENVKETSAWCEENCKHHFTYHVYQYSVRGSDWGYCVWLIEDPTDAFGFKMRWV